MEMQGDRHKVCEGQISSGPLLLRPKRKKTQAGKKLSDDCQALHPGKSEYAGSFLNKS